MSDDMNKLAGVSYGTILLVAARFLLAAIRGAVSGSTIPTPKPKSGLVRYRVDCGSLGRLDITQRSGRVRSRSLPLKPRTPKGVPVSTSMETTPSTIAPLQADASSSLDGREMRLLNAVYQDLR